MWNSRAWFSEKTEAHLTHGAKVNFSGRNYNWNGVRGGNFILKRGKIRGRRS